MPLVELRGARVVLDGVTVFDALDFALEEGQSAAIIGANGAGKTTVLRVLAGQLWPVPAESRVYTFGNKPTWSPLRAREEIALVSPLAQERVVQLGQDGADGERGARLCVRDCIATGLFDSFLLHQSPTAAQERRVEELLSTFDLELFAERDVNTLSQGQLRRALLARALVKEPRLVLLDEAASGLDVAAREELFSSLELWHKARTSFVFASHRDEELPSWAARYELHEGRLHQLSFVEAAKRRTDDTDEPSPCLALPSHHTTSRSKPLFWLRRARVFFDGVPILRDLDFEWQRGEHLRVLGENGSGKTTFLRLLGGELAPAHGGEIVRLGQTHRPIWEWRQRIALVSPQLQARFHDAISVRDALASGLLGGFLPPREFSAAQAKRVDDLLDEWNLRALSERRFDRLSYGQTRRVLLARALASEPEVVLLDEALDGLDASTRAFCFGHWEKLARRGTHFAFASHHEADFPAWATRGVKLTNGRLNHSES